MLHSAARVLVDMFKDREREAAQALVQMAVVRDSW